MADEAPVSSALRSDNLITVLNPNDVILGRGAGPSQFIGNLLYRSRVQARQEKYASLTGHKPKAKVARELFDQIQSLGGRFLKPVESENVLGSVGQVWYEVDEALALQKCKQALRDCGRKQGPSDGNDDGTIEKKQGDIGSGEVTMSSPVSITLPSSASYCSSALGDNSTPVVPSILIGSMGPPCASGHTSQGLLQGMHCSMDTSVTAAWRRYLAREVVVSDQTDSGITVATTRPSTLEADVSGRASQIAIMNTSAAATYGSYLANRALPWQLGHLMMRQQRGSASSEPGENRHLRTGGEWRAMDRGGTIATVCSSTDDVTAAAPEDDMSGYVLSLLTLGRPMFTEEQLEMERAAMTHEDRLAALSDMFGKKCAVETPQRKRAKSDLDQKSIEFFVQQMRLELERIPKDRKRALVEAQTKCHASEFSDARLERFLRCEGMNAKLGAHRFVNYWESRRELFGPEKFVMRMTLSEALCDDLVAVEVGLCQLLPHLDTSGRQLLLWDPCRHRREGYSGTLESMLRALWYVIDVTAKVNTDIRSGVVMIIWNKESTIWDFDYKFYERMTYFERTCWPVKRLACHVCFAPWIVVNIGKPMIYALLDKNTRSRTLFHGVPESQILDVLSGYGILKDMLPTKMGGTVRFDQAEWIANRRAADLEEI